jgi:hypothetical protein
MFISETHFPHAAVSVNHRDWYGFKPKAHRHPLGPGFVDRSDQTASIEHFAIFMIDDAKIRRAIPPVVKRYQASWYKVGVHDCVSFATDVAGALGLRIPRRPNFLPDHFVTALTALNSATGG